MSNPVNMWKINYNFYWKCFKLFKKEKFELLHKAMEK